jgi:predicted deacylase
VTSETPGIWIRHVDNGQTIKAGSVIGEIVEISGLSSLPVRATTTALVGAVRKRGQVVKGDDLAWLFSEMNEG